MSNKCVILIPALDPPQIFLQYIEKLIDAGFKSIIVVDDGSNDKKIFTQIQNHPEVIVLIHEKNFGKGKALRTGLDYYHRHFQSDEYAGVITVDSDGQHLVEDVKKVQDCLMYETQKLILGVRDFNQRQVPPKSRYGNKLTSGIFRVFLGLSISDTQTGLRGIPNALVESCLTIEGDRFEYETAMLIKVGKEAGIEEVGIHTVYYDQNQGTHFHPIKDSALIYRMIFGTFFRYLFASLSSFVLDIFLFALGTKLLFHGTVYSIPLATFFARILSGTYNFFMNRNIVFKSTRNYAVSSLFYLLLCIIQGVLSATLVTGICYILHVEEVFIKIIVDTCLFLVNYQVQKIFIFRS